MAKQTKTLADVQTVTTVNDDQLIPITDASGNVVKVSMSNLRSILIGHMRASSINLIDQSEKIEVINDSAAKTTIKKIAIGPVSKGEYFSVSVGSVETLGEEVSAYASIIYDSNQGKNLSNMVYLNVADKQGIFEITSDCDNASLLIYSGEGPNLCLNRSVRYMNYMFTKGNMPCPSWFPSYNDIKALVAAGSTTLQSE